MDASLEEQAEFYDEWNLAHRSAKFDEIDRKVRARTIIVLRWLENIRKSDLDILEVGCGTGWLTEKLARFGNVLAIDLSTKAIDFAVKRKIGAKFIAGNFLDHDFGADRFDVIVCAETLFYVDDQQLFLKRASEMIKPGGLFAMTAINKFVYERVSDVSPQVTGQIRNWLSKRQLKKLLSSHFRIESIVTVLPEGDRGLLRLTNSHRLNRVAGRLFGAETVLKLKERLGLGGGLAILARKPLDIKDQ